MSLHSVHSDNQLSGHPPFPDIDIRTLPDDIASTILKCSELYYQNKPFGKKWASPNLFLPLQTERETYAPSLFGDISLENLTKQIKENGYYPESTIEVIDVNDKKYIIEGHHRNFANARVGNTLIPYETIAKDVFEDVSYPWETIASGDPRWWNTPEMESILNDMNYTLSNSKYIQLSTHLSMSDIYWQCVILIRGLLDNRNETQYTNIALSTMINGKSEMSIFEAVLILEILMNWQITTARGDSLRGDMYLPNGRFNGSAACLDMLFNGLQYYDPVLYPDVTQEQDGLPNPLIEGLPYKVSSFNFNLRTDDNDFYQSIQYMEYLEPNTLYQMLDRIYDRNENNIGSVLMGDVKKVFSFLETKLQQASNIHEFRQVTEAYNHLFLVDPNRNWYDEGTINVDAYLTEAYQLSYNELTQLKTFFEPNHEDLTIEYQNESFPISIYNIMNLSLHKLLSISYDY